MSAPVYAFRICAALHGGPTIELHRSRSDDWAPYFNAFTKDLSPEWDTWVEQRTPDRYLIGGRIKFPERSGGTDAIRLTHEMKKQAGILLT